VSPGCLWTKHAVFAVAGQGGIWPAVPTAAHGWYSFYEASFYEASFYAVSAECKSGVSGRSRKRCRVGCVNACGSTNVQVACNKERCVDGFYFEIDAANVGDSKSNRRSFPICFCDSVRSSMKKISAPVCSCLQIFSLALSITHRSIHHQEDWCARFDFIA
jgi:hypothetical protein